MGVRIPPSAPKAQVRGLRPFGCARKVANNTLRVEARAPNKGRSEGSNPSGIDLRISQQCPLLEIESMAWGHGSTRERQPTFLEIQIAVGVDPVSDRTRSARIDSTARLSGSPSQWTEPGPHAVTRHLHGTTLPPRAWDHLVPHSCRPTVMLSDRRGGVNRWASGGPGGTRPRAALASPEASAACGRTRLR